MNRDACVHLARCIVLVIAVLMVVSCKLRIIVPEGGSVKTQTGAYRCAAGQTCNINVVDFFFDRTFIAEPASGYEFRFWKKADRRFCGGKNEPCRVFTAGLDANEDLAVAMMSFFESDEVFYLQPVFRRRASATGCTPAATYNLTLSGRDTAQVGTSLETGDMEFGREDLTGPSLTI